jgi:hypothetical protein
MLPTRNRLGRLARRAPAPREKAPLAYALLAAMGLALAGCYTVMTHPGVTPDQQVTEQGRVISENQCGGCHNDSELWSYHHDSYFPAGGYRGGWDRRYYRNHRYFLSLGWYPDTYYSRWNRYYRRPWWHDSPGHPAGPAARTAGRSPAEGRGTDRDGYDRIGPRTSDFVPVGSGPDRPLSYSDRSIPVYIGGGSVGRVASDSTPPAMPAVRRGPDRVRPRSSAQPATSTTSPNQSQPRQDTKKEASEDDDDEEESSSGRGSSRRGTGGSRGR